MLTGSVSDGTWDNEVGVPYTVMRVAHGHALSEYDWAPVSTPGYIPPLPPLPLPDRGREKILSQLGTTMVQLSSIRYTQMSHLGGPPSCRGPVELHLGSIFVQKALNITCITDWCSTSVGTITELLTPPGFGSKSSPAPAASCLHIQVGV